MIAYITVVVGVPIKSIIALSPSQMLVAEEIVAVGLEATFIVTDWLKFWKQDPKLPEVTEIKSICFELVTLRIVSVAWPVLSKVWDCIAPPFSV